jgi:hypothetical protein
MSRSSQHAAGILVSIPVFDTMGMLMTMFVPVLQKADSTLLCRIFMFIPYGCIIATIILFLKPVRSRLPLLERVPVFGRYVFCWALSTVLMVTFFVASLLIVKATG